MAQTAQEVLSRVEQAFQSGGGVSATFTVTAPGSGTAQGSIDLQGEKFVLEAAGVKTWFDGSTQWSYVASADEVNVSTPTAEELQTLNPYAWLSTYRQGYSAQVEADGAGHHVTLTATDRKSAWQRIAITVTAASRLRRVELTPMGSTEATVISIDSYRDGLSYPDNHFTWQRSHSPTAEVIDLR